MLLKGDRSKISTQNRIYEYKLELAGVFLYYDVSEISVLFSLLIE